MSDFDLVTIQLKSVTIFWTDLGGPRLLTAPHKNILAVWWDNEVEPWIKTAIKGHCNPHETGVWFAEPRDAALFMTRFSGQFPPL